MSQLRQRFRVAWDDQPEVTVTTSARDVAAIGKYLPIDNGKADPVAAVQADPTIGFRLVHAALVRSDAAGVPTEFDTFVDLLDECEALDSIPALPDPTNATG